MRISEHVQKAAAGSNCYYLDMHDGILIDTGEERFRKQLLSEIDPSKVKHVILTHLHYDHIGNVECFTDARIYASAEELRSLEEKPLGTVLDNARLRAIEKLIERLEPVKGFEGLRVIHTPGHTSGSICLFLEDEGILFSGDTIFDHGVGRTDLPTSEPDLMQQSLDMLGKLKVRLLCPGHDY